MKRALIVLLFVLTASFSFTENKEGTIQVLPGTQVKGVLLNGGYMPSTLSGGEGNPVYILLHGYATMPNQINLNMDYAVLSGYAVGNLVADRVDIRIFGLSYVDYTGEGHFIPVDGEVHYQGLTGVPGKVITKEWQLVSKTILASFLNTMSKWVENQSFTGTPSSGVVDLSQIAKGTASQPMAELAQLYMEQIKSLSPQVLLLNNLEVTVFFGRMPFPFKTLDFKG